MKQFFLGIVLLALLFPFSIGTAAQQEGGRWQQQAAKYGWMLNYNRAKALAHKTGKPMMVVFRCVP